MALFMIDSQTFSIIITFSLVIMAIVLTFVIAPRFKKQKAKELLRKTGIEADAIILNMRQTGLYVNQQPQVSMQVQVQPDRGRNFVTEARQVFSPAELGFIHTGSKIRVRYNPENTKEIMLVS
ncbi:MAG: hypothetical protein V4722_25930 [Bacteroidota bacterium]